MNSATGLSVAAEGVFYSWSERVPTYSGLCTLPVSCGS